MRILIVECMQEISSFNPVPSTTRASVSTARRRAVCPARAQHRDRRRAVGLRGRAATSTLVPAYGARAGSAGLLSARAGSGCRRELLAASTSERPGIDGIYVSLHGAMGADGELDPEGHLLTEIRAHRRRRDADRHLARPARHPHRPHAAPGRRARDLPHLSACRFRRHRRAAPRGCCCSCSTAASSRSIARVVIPALVRGDELITKTGCYGDLIRECQRLERDGIGARRRHHDRQPLHRRAGAVLARSWSSTDGDEAPAEREADAARARSSGRSASACRASSSRSTAPSPRRARSTGR